MDPTLTNTQAHKVFGDLYRKQRPADLQQKVDQIVSDTADVFVRIKRIEDLDAGYQAERRLKEGDLAGGPKRVARGGAGSGGGRKRVATKKPQAKKQRSGGGGAGFFSWLFGGAGGGNELTRWGEETGTIESGLFSRGMHLSSAVPAIFDSFREDQITPTAKGFRYAIAGAWEELEPARYNAIIAAYQFFSEFVKAGVAFRKSEEPEIWITETIKLQKFYAFLLQYPEFDKILTRDLPAFIKRGSEAQAFAPAVKASMDYIVALENRKPTLKNAILAVYILARKRLYEWSDIVKELNVSKPALDTYRGPEQVMAKITQRVSDLKTRYNQCAAQLKEVDKIKGEYFQTDANGRLKTDFLNPIVNEVVHRTYGESAINESLLQSHKREPHRLLFAVLKDMDLSFINLMNGSVGVRTESHHHEDVLLFKQGLFKSYGDRFSQVMREMEAFMKKHRDISYSFADFMNELKELPDDPIVRNFHAIVKNSIDLLAKINVDMQTVLGNHELALDRERAGKVSESLAQTKVLPVESLQVESRFMPYADREIVTNTRLNGRTVHSVIEELSRNVYNFLYIFRDPELTRALNSGPQLQKQMSEYKDRLVRLGAQPDNT
ncbi:MAG: hypothetical protein NXI24_03805 [bacterium]|nr:hypothetical protein [bacterium]